MFKHFSHTANECPVNIPDDVPFQISAMYVHHHGFPYPCKVLDILDYQRNYVCIRTDIYPLMWVLWFAVKKLIDFDYFLRGRTYWFFRNVLNGGDDFVPANQFVGGWKGILKHFVRYKLNEKQN